MRTDTPNTIWDPKWAGTGRNILYKMYTLENDKRVYHYLAIKWKGSYFSFVGWMDCFDYEINSFPFLLYQHPFEFLYFIISPDLSNTAKSYRTCREFKGLCSLCYKCRHNTRCIWCINDLICRVHIFFISTLKIMALGTETFRHVPSPTTTNERNKSFKAYLLFSSLFA